MIISKQQLITNIVTELSDNSTGLISPRDIRHNLLDIIDSAHNLLQGKDLDTNNFASLDTRSTRAGKETFKNYYVTNSNNEDNSAFGHSALRNNFQGTKNTALGSSALSCNVYGGDNVAVGFKSVSANTTGYGNVGLGTYTLESNKFGNYNVAIGNAAGYYVGRNTSNKLYIASHPVDSGYICANPSGIGLTPLVYGDFSSVKFGIGVKTLHSDGTLQVSGNITPSQNAQFNLGSDSYQFDRLYLSSGIKFPSGNIAYSHDLEAISVSGNVLPLQTNTYNLGSENNRWNVGYFKDVIAESYTEINRTVSDCYYECKTLYLAATGICEGDSECGYLNDQELVDAGFVVQSSGDNNSYLRNYYFKFKPYNSTLTWLENDNVYSRSSWNSNISIHISGGCHLLTDRVIGSGHLSLVTQPSGMGIYIRDDFLGKKIYFGKTANHSINGVGDINFLHGSINDNVVDIRDYVCTFGALQPGVNVSHRFLSNTRVNELDQYNSKPKLKGFEVKYFDDSDINYDGPLSDRFAISSYDNTSEPIHSLILMKGGDSEGVVGINDFEGTSHLKLPETALNIRSARNAVIRATAENDGYYESSLQLFGHENCVNSGLDITYFNHSGIADISMYKKGNKEIFIRMDEDSKIGFFAVSGQMHDMITIGGSGHSKSVVSICETTGAISPTQKYGKLYVKQRQVYDKQSSSIYFMDSSGNQFNLALNKYDSNDNLVYSDIQGNTLGGMYCNGDRSILENKAYDNTGFGFLALQNLTSGDRNVAIGTSALLHITSGTDNIAIGYKALYDSNEAISGNIVIGNNYLGRDLASNDTLLIGNGDHPIISGNLSTDERHLFLPHGKIEIQSEDNVEKLLIKNNTIEVIDAGGDDYPQNQLSFKFTGNESVDLLLLSHSGDPLSNSGNYEFANSGLPSAELKGDLKLQGAIRFSDNTSLYSSSGISFAHSLAINNASRLDELLIEGIAQQTILAGNYNSPTVGYILTSTGEEVLVSNKDRFLQINHNDFVVAIKIGSEYRPLWVSSESTACQCCGH